MRRMYSCTVPSRRSRPRHSKPSSVERPLVCNANSGNRNRFTSAFRERDAIAPTGQPQRRVVERLRWFVKIRFHTQHRPAWYDGSTGEVKSRGVLKVIEGYKGCRRKKRLFHGVSKPKYPGKSRFQPPTSSVSTSQSLGSNLPVRRIEPPTSLGSNLPRRTTDVLRLTKGLLGMG